MTSGAKFGVRAMSMPDKTSWMTATHADRRTLHKEILVNEVHRRFVEQACGRVEEWVGKVDEVQGPLEQYGLSIQAVRQEMLRDWPLCPVYSSPQRAS